ncbi:MAG: sensor histidine kinase [Casimicrobiaceae bacterium]
MRVAHEQLRAFAQERELFFQDMHDGCIQAIYAVGLNLEACRTLLDENPAKAARTIAAAATNLNLVIQDLRSLITDQGQQSPTARNLRSEIERAVRAVGENGPAFAVRIDAGAEQALTPDQTFHLLQIAREGISNATRHAKARKGKLSLRLRGGNFRFEVTDDGIGFDTAMADRYGLGLYHISARARRLGGEASVKSAPNEGTRIVVQIPLKR